MIKINENLNITGAKNSKLRKISLILILSFILMVLYSSISFAAIEWNGKDKAYNNGEHGHGVFLDVYNNRTGLHYDGIYHSSYESNLVVEDGDFKNGDVLSCHAFTCYAYGEYYVYKGNTVPSLSEDDHFTGNQHAEDLYWTVTITSKVTKIWSSTDAHTPKQYWVSVLIYSTADEEPPTVSVNKTKVLKDTSVRITVNDNESAKGYKVTTSASKPTGGFTNFGSNSTSNYVDYTCSSTGTFYAWGIDEEGNIGGPASFTVGTAPNGSISAPAVKEGQSVTYTCTVSSGTSPYKYTWSKGGSGALRTTGFQGASDNYTYSNASRNDNGNTIYCEIDNEFAKKTVSATMTVYYPPTATVKCTYSSQNTSDKYGEVRKGDKATLVCTASGGNPTNYSYQWYQATGNTGGGTRIAGATSSTYNFYPTANQDLYFYCVVTTSQYTVESSPDRVHIRTDVTQPTIVRNTFDENIYRNRNGHVIIPFTITDTGYNSTVQSFETNKFVASNIKVKVKREDGNIVDVDSGTTKTISFKGKNGNNYSYSVDITGIKDNGKLRIEIPADGFKDKFGNGNVAYSFNTNVEIDNIDPTIHFNKTISGQQRGYLSSRDTDLVIELYVKEKIGMDPSEFTTSDIGVKTAKGVAPAAGDSGLQTAQATLQYVKKEGILYYYRLTLSHITGDGDLYVYVKAGNVRDWARNGNAEQTSQAENVADIIIKKDDDWIIIDNTPPTFGSPSVSRYFDKDGDANYVYPNKLPAWHENWTNKTVYMTVNATDDYNPKGDKIDYYTTSRDSKASFTKLAGDYDPYNKDFIEYDYNNTVYFRVYDKAGNMSETSCEVKVDKTPPAPTTILLHEERPTGALYVFNKDKPINKTIYSVAAEAKDLGAIQSGVKIDLTDSSNANSFNSFYEIRHYNSIDDKTQIGETKKASLNISAITGDPIPLNDVNNSAMKPNHVICEEDGYYEFTSTTYDKAGNVAKIVLEGSSEVSSIDTTIVKDPVKLHIKKRTNNVIRIFNLDDIGSGVDYADIIIYEGTEALDSRIIKNEKVKDLYKEYTISTTLNKGDYLVKVILHDKVDNNTTLTKIIHNNL